MKTRLVNHNQMRRMNRREVLNLLRRTGSSSRVEIAKTLRCDGTTVTNIVRDLLAADVVRAIGSDISAGIGRPREKIELNRDVKLAIGLSFDPRYIMGVVVNLGGEIKLQEQVHFESDVSQKELLCKLDLLVDRLIDYCGRGKLLGIGISTFGVLSPEDRIIRLAADFPALQSLDFNAHFVKISHVHPTVIDRTLAMGLAEIELKKRTASSTLDFLLLDVGTGIGCCIVMKGELVYGAGGYVSEFGHTVIDIDGNMCRCGHRGCLETLASIPAIEKGVANRLGAKRIGFDAIVKSYLAGDPTVGDVVHVAARGMGVGIANLVNLFNPTEIVLSGQLLDLGKPYLDVVRATAREFSLPQFFTNLRIVASSLGPESAAMGATKLLLEKFFDKVGTHSSWEALGANSCGD